MPHTFLPSLLKETTVYSYWFFSFTTLNKDSTISLIPKEMSSSVHTSQCRADKQRDKIIASPGCSLINVKLRFKQGWLRLATTACLHEAAVELVKRQWFLSMNSAAKTAELQLCNIAAAEFSAPTGIRRTISLGRKKKKKGQGSFHKKK